jgi:hypothetical protein
MKRTIALSLMLVCAAAPGYAEVIECPAIEGQALKEVDVDVGPTANGEVPDVIKASEKPAKLLEIWKLERPSPAANPDDARWFLRCLYVPLKLANANVGMDQMKVQRLFKLPESFTECREVGYPVRAMCK